jgi:hypothetical protein
MTDYLDTPVEISTDRPLRLSADTMRALRKATGRTMTELLSDDEDEADRIQALAFVELHRRAARLGHLPDAATLWDQAGVIEVDFNMPQPVDPLGGGSSTTSPPSATTGG